MTKLDVNVAIAASQHLKTAIKRDIGAVLVAGGGGKLGGEVVRRLTASVSLGRYKHLTLLVTANFHASMAGVRGYAVTEDIMHWPLFVPQEQMQTAVVMFEPPRMYYHRERSIWTPHPDDLPALAKWLYANGVQHLVIVMPHQPGTLPDALQQGLANLDEQLVTSLGFKRVVFMRMAQTDRVLKANNFFQRVANGVLGVSKYMLPSNQNPLRVSQIAQLVEEVLQKAPSGHFVVSASGELPKAWAMAESNG